MKASNTNTLLVNEIFYSIQGESLTAGEPTTFVRLTGCPLRCSYCDTSYAFKDGKELSFENIITKISSYNTSLVTVTGGEPLAQENCYTFLNLLSPRFSVSLETSNAYPIKDVNKNVTIILDVKTPKSNESDSNIELNYKYLKNNDQIKFVICDKTDYDWSVDYIRKHKLSEKCKILFSPSYDEMSPTELADLILSDGLQVRLQIQLHKCQGLNGVNFFCFNISCC